MELLHRINTQKEEKMIDAYANVPFTYTYNLGLDGSQTWTAQTIAVTLDYATIIDASNVVMSNLNSTLINQANANLPNPNNYTLTITANGYQMQQLGANSVDPNERVLIVQTLFTSNTGSALQANNLYLRIKNSLL